ncbi:molybdenum cofactor biosynthesis protein [Coprinopsis cinerea okayama7|uniref:Molybdenum cofactor biosynthesis protein n=1 Tax=Coprinopsis cinerea (strain Okayama-7 / 130 / ATCC MYA-4618 / FGSC 9003) TaxID=240176 RepID=D6RN01_COPC7|nr:molybdenum cofactor biosynthesis protein [Coprinopsis cinerea okayama7\|eukprot:XP_002911283.1 molybdenum cofactor biosynthesis protein [Coprinopsis cinerea okayama7\
MASKIYAAILTVSDTAAHDKSADRSGPTIQQILADRDIAVREEDYKIVSDDAAAIQATVKEWLARQNRRVDWIVTTGGTGFGARDITPEAISPLLERQAPGLVHLLISSSLKHTPLAALSRPAAGTSGSTIVTTLPGSVKAVKECLDALFMGGVITHAIDLARGGTGKQVHAALGTSHGASEVQHSHGHGHGHGHGHHGCGRDHAHGGHHPPKPRSGGLLSHDPNAPASARHRQSPYPIISLEEALKLVDEHTERLTIETRAVDHTLRGYVLAEDVYAPHNVPPTPTTNVDGYAIRSTDPPGVYKVVTSSDHRLSDVVPEGTVYRINTGGPLPAATDAVIMVEDTKLVSTYPDSGEEKEIETLAQVPAGENVRKAGSDVQKGDLVMHAGDRILSVGGEVGTLAFVGRKEVKVYRKPVVALLSTGNELVDLQRPKEDQGSESWSGIYDTNRPSLQAVLEGLGFEVTDLGIVSDHVNAHVEAIQKGLNQADLILTTGGTSMGPTDLLKPVIERNFKGTIHFGRVAIKPGKPTTFATIPFIGTAQEEVHKPVFALPGNPASALVTFYVFVLPALRKLGGWPDEVKHLPRVRVQVKSPMLFDPRLEFHRAVIKVQTSTGVLEAWSTGGQRSSRVASLSGANGFVIVPPLKGQGKTKLEVDEWAEAILIGELQVG